MDPFSDLDESAATSAKDDIPAGEPVKDVPALVRHYIEHWPGYVGAIDKAQASVSAVRAAEEMVQGDSVSGWKWQPLHHQDFDELAAAAVNAITLMACDTLCSGDANVLSPYTGKEMATECGALADPRQPDFLRYWRALEARFGGGAGKRAALAGAARQVRRDLGIWPEGRKERRWQSDPKIERGGVTFDLCARWLEKRECSGGGYELHYNAGGAIGTLCTALGSVLGNDFRSSLHSHHFFRLRHERLKPPYRVDIDGCRWTLLTDGARLWMPQNLALTLRALLDEYDPAD